MDSPTIARCLLVKELCNTLMLLRDIIYMAWCFALLNNRLAELYFEHDKEGKPLISGHGYVDDTRGWSKHEQKLIAQDLKKYQFSYWKGRYRDMLKDIRHKAAPPPRHAASLTEKRETV